MTDIPQHRFAGVLARHRGRVVLVCEEYPTWGGTYWNIPSGRIEEDETPSYGAARELAEETGLVVGPDDLVLTTTSSVVHRAGVTQAWNFTAVVADPALAVNDPDGLVQEARWFDADEAVRLLRELPYRPLSEPAVAILSDQDQAGAHWAYADPAAPPVVTGWSGHGTA